MSSSTRLDARAWLRAHGYEEVALTIDALQAKWKRKGLRTRRDWFLVCAGTPDGKPCTVGGKTFPVIAAFRARAGYPPVPHAIAKTKGERAPRVADLHRWTNRPPKKKVPKHRR